MPKDATLPTLSHLRIMIAQLYGVNITRLSLPPTNVKVSADGQESLPRISRNIRASGDLKT